MKLIAVTVLCLFIQATMQTCSNGCLRCSPEEVCEYCDLEQNYKLQNGDCVKFESENCLIKDLTGECLQCDKYAYLDQETKKCVSLPNTSLIPNCVFYQNSTTCLMCGTKYYVSENKCVAVETEIPRCEFYISPTTCSQCFTGAVLSTDNTRCYVINNLENCAVFTFFKCDSCATGYLKDENLYFRQDFDFTNQTKVDALRNTYYNASKGISITAKKELCVEKLITGCKDYENSLTCRNCGLGFYKTDNGVCDPFPGEQIQSCEEYASYTVCKKCQAGFYLESDSQCRAVVAIDKCVAYNGAANITLCIECESGFFVSGNKCVSRSNIVEQCVEFQKTSDKCSSCGSGFAVTGDGLKCLPAIASCTEYNPSSNRDSEKLICKVCTRGFYLDPSVNECKEGDVENCETYQDSSSPICSKCVNEFYLDSNKKCVKHDSVENCNLYHHLANSVCTDCNPLSFKFELINECKLPPTTINNCKTYSNVTTCSSCHENNYLKDNACLEIPNSLNCTRFNGFECFACKPNFVLFSGICVSVPAHISSFCEKNNTNVTDTENTVTLDTYECTSCVTGAFPYTLKDNFVCVANELNTKLVDNCVAYENEVCVRCKENLFLTNGLCTESCTGSVLRNSFELKDQKTMITQNGWNLCQQSSTCLAHSVKMSSFETALAANAEIEYVCTKCAVGLFSVIIPQNEVWTREMVDPQAPFSPVQQTPELFCLENTNITILGTLVDGKITNCEHYSMVQNGAFGCVKCINGYSGEVVDSSARIGYIKECKQIENCEANVYQPGLNVNLMKYMSCFKCVNTMIPFVYAEAKNPTENVYNLKRFNYQVVPKENGSGGIAVTCHEPVGSSFGFTDNEFGFPDNCATGVFNLDLRSSVSFSNKSKEDGGKNEEMPAFCSACKPGFKPVYFEAGAPMIISCVAIQHCKAESTWLNACSQCDDGFIYNYDNTKGIDYTMCVSNAHDTNCYVSMLNAQNQPGCKYCKPGYSPNAENKCELIEPIECANTTFTLFRNVIIKDTGFLLDKYPLGVGCSQCNSNYHLQKLTTDKPVCLKNNIITADPASSSILIANCSSYNLDQGQVRCTRCDNDFMLIGNTSCVSKANLPFCKKATNESICETCEETFVNFSGKCIEGKLDKCLIYKSTSSIDVQTCEKCETDYYVSNKVCVQGSVHNCLDYKTDGSGDCLTCNPSTFPVTANGKLYCYPVNPDWNCKELDSTFANGKFACKTCKDNMYMDIAQSSPTKNVCLPFSQIPNCAEYDKGNTINLSSFKCTKCETNYYLKNGICIERTNKTPNCKTFIADADHCKDCIAGFFIDFKHTCVSYPDGLRGCINYTSKDTCIACKERHYLSDNNCIAVPEAEQIPNCLYYKTKDKCLSCEKNFAVEEDKCVAAIAKDCASYIDKNNCQSCLIGYGLKQEKGITNCEKVTNPNCVVYNNISPYECLLCEQNFYPNDIGGCSAVTVNIPNCKSYDSKTTCLQCIKGLVLSVDRKRCEEKGVAILDQNCYSYRETAEPVCSMCLPGYYFRDGECTSCVKNSVASGCFACDPYNDDRCILCRSYHKMNSKGECISTLATTDPGPIVPNSVRYLLLTALSVVVLVLY